MIELPEVDIEPLLTGGSGTGKVAAAIHQACRDLGFFYVTGHDVEEDLRSRLDSSARQFFALPEAEKAEIAMSHGGRAWRGWFPVGAELTSGVPDTKEGLYFGAELDHDHPRVSAGVPLHGANLFPRRPVVLRTAVMDYLKAMTLLGQSVLSGMALALGLGESWFSDNLTADPLILFRIFRYPPLGQPPTEDSPAAQSPAAQSPAAQSPAAQSPAVRVGDDDHGGQWSVGEHTDYGLLTLLAQDDSGGLQVETSRGWIDVPPRRGTFVCNLGDMLERLTGGVYKSTPHRVRNVGTSDRLSFPFFLDPSWDANVDRLPFTVRPDDTASIERWDHTSVHEHSGTYGEYILKKVGRVFPDLSAGIISTS
jgi:isopenicillin N synthase-like dioxygenase